MNNVSYCLFTVKSNLILQTSEEQGHIVYVLVSIVEVPDLTI